jgi:hypothetical protein
VRVRSFLKTVLWVVLAISWLVGWRFVTMEVHKSQECGWVYHQHIDIVEHTDFVAELFSTHRTPPKYHWWEERVWIEC